MAPRTETVSAPEPPLLFKLTLLGEVHSLVVNSKLSHPMTTSLSGASPATFFATEPNAGCKLFIVLCWSTFFAAIVLKSISSINWMACEERKRKKYIFH